jgi:uracil-DNA glycosylase family 4
MIKVKDNPTCAGCKMLEVDCTYEKAGRKIHHIGKDMTFVAPTLGPSLRLALARDPGEQENIEGRPLVGPAGKFLDALYRKAGVQRDQLTVLNCRQCKPPGNIDPLSNQARFYISEADAKAATAQCWANHVEPVLRSRPWLRIDALGGEALEALTGVKGGINLWRGSPLPLKNEEKPRVIGTFHPSFIMVYGQNAIPTVVSDLRKGTTPPPEHYNLNPTLDDVAAFRATKFAFDMEWSIFTGQITMVGLSDSLYHCMVVPFRGPYIAELKRIFNNATDLIGHNITTADIPQLEKNGIKLTHDFQIWDTILMHHLLHPDAAHDLDFVGSVYSSKPRWKYKANENKELYCARDTDVTLQAFEQMLPVLRQQGLENLYKYTQVPLAKICYLMEQTGVHTSGDRANVIRQGWLKEIAELEQTLPDELRPHDKPIRVRHPAPPGTIGKSGKPIKYIHVPGTERVVPWNSPEKVKDYLYQTLGLPEQKNAKTKKTTSDKTALERLYNRTKLPVLQTLRKLGSLDNMQSSFVKGMKDKDGNEIPIRDGKVTPHFSPYGTSSGRLSSSGPNFQNQPPAARYIYVPSDPTWSLIECVTPETRILDADLRWRRADSFAVGDKLVGFDEAPINARRKTSQAVVTNTSKILKQTYRLVTSQGNLCVSENHTLLVNRHRTNLRWIKGSELVVGDEIAFFCRPWEEEESKEAGWLAGVFDGEGYLKPNLGLGFGQNPGLVLSRTRELLNQYGFQYGISTTRKCHKLGFKQEAFSGLRFVGMFRPIRLLEKAKRAIYQRQVWGKNTIRAVIQKIENLGVGPVIALETSTHTYIAEGMLSHNCDYSSGENRLTAWYANDHERLQRLATPGFSEHKLNAEIFFGVPYAEVVKDNSPDAYYGRAKKLTHGINYGEGPRKIAQTLDLPEKDVRDWLFKWREANRPTVDWMERVSNEAARTGVLTNCFNRKRYFWTDRLYGESLSYLPQSTLADIIHRAGIGLMYERIGWPVELALKASKVLAPLPWPARLLAQVHDAFLIEAPTELVPEVVKCLKATMEQPFAEMGGFSLPIEVSVGAMGDSWGELKKYKEEGW